MTTENANTASSMFNSTDLSKFYSAVAEAYKEPILRIMCVDMAIRLGADSLYVTLTAQEICDYIKTGKTIKTECHE